METTTKQSLTWNTTLCTNFAHHGRKHIHPTYMGYELVRVFSLTGFRTSLLSASSTQPGQVKADINKQVVQVLSTLSLKLQQQHQPRDTRFIREKLSNWGKIHRVKAKQTFFQYYVLKKAQGVLLRVCIMTCAVLWMGNSHSQGVKGQYMYMCSKVQETPYMMGIYMKLEYTFLTHPSKSGWVYNT
jgi:hypothetical protein